MAERFTGIKQEAFGNAGGYTSAMEERGQQASGDQMAVFNSVGFQQNMRETYGTGQEGSLMAGSGHGGEGMGGTVNVHVFLGAGLQATIEHTKNVVTEITRESQSSVR
jgi:hypothetical protein